ncbi:MAG: hypothetical protein PHY56_00515 [Candidatus Omnitrophica bacterium]|nr:hypothetical protein [Candidatus Omnitrophota bacterium]
MQLKILLALILNLFWVEITLAAPSISSHTGVLTKGEAITITGADFGSTGPTIYKWDDFEGATHTVGQTMGAGSGDKNWIPRSADESTNEPKVLSTANRTNSTKCIRCTYEGDGNKYGCMFFYLHGATLSPVYVSWYIKWDNAGTSETDNEKFWRIFYTTNTDTAPSSWDAPLLSMAKIGGDSQTIDWIANHGTSNEQKYLTSPTENNWVRMEYYGVESTDDTSDGTIIITQQQTSTSTFSDIWSDNTQETKDNGHHWTALFWGEYANMASTSGRLYYHDFDDIYIANSRARVEIGDASTWATCTHREIQIPTAWAAGEITATLNTGSFADDATVYLYVVDADGAVNSNGYVINLGEGGSSISKQGISSCLGCTFQ